MFNKKVSVVLSTYNAKERLRMALASYEFQSFPKELFEVIVIDDGSTDGTFEMMKHRKYSYSLTYRYYRRNAGRAIARNRGLELATGEIIIFSDSDMIAEQDFILKHVAHHEKDDQIFVGGNFWNRVYTHIYPAKNIIQGLNKLTGKKLPLFKNSSIRKQLKTKKYVPLMTIEDLRKNDFLRTLQKQPWANFYEQIANRYGQELIGFHFPWVFFVVMNASVRRKHLDNVGFFDEGFKGWGGEDEELGLRLFQSGVRGMVDTEIKNYHQEHPRILNKQDKEQANNKLYLVQKHLSITTILNYYFSEIDIFTKNKFLNQLSLLKENGLVSKTFHTQIEKLLQYYFEIHYANKSAPCPLDKESKDGFKEDLDKLTVNPDLVELALFIEKNLLINEREYD